MNHLLSYSPGRRALMQLSRAGYSKQQIDILLKDFIAACPTPTDYLFIDYALSIAPDSIKEFLSGSCLASSWAPSDSVITLLAKNGYRREFLTSHCSQLFRDHIATSSLMPIDLNESFLSFVTRQFPKTERFSDYGWYPSAYQLAELQHLGYSIEHIHGSLNIFRSTYMTQIKGPPYSAAFYLFVTAGNTTN